MKGLFIRIAEGLEREFNQICRQEGYKKGAVIERLLRDFVNQQQAGNDPIRAAQEFGIDTTLLEVNLRKTPTERLRSHERLHAFSEKLRVASKRR